MSVEAVSLKKELLDCFLIHFVVNIEYGEQPERLTLPEKCGRFGCSLLNRSAGGQAEHPTTWFIPLKTHHLPHKRPRAAAVTLALNIPHQPAPAVQSWTFGKERGSLLPLSCTYLSWPEPGWTGLNRPKPGSGQLQPPQMYHKPLYFLCQETYLCVMIKVLFPSVSSSLSNSTNISDTFVLANNVLTGVNYSKTKKSISTCLLDQHVRPWAKGPRTSLASEPSEMELTLTSIRTKMLTHKKMK